MKIGLLFALFFLILVIGIVNNVFGSTNREVVSQQNLVGRNFDQIRVNEIELFFYSAPKALNWSSPSSLIQSAVSNSLSPVLGPSSLNQEGRDVFKGVDSEIFLALDRAPLSKEDLVSALQEPAGLSYSNDSERGLSFHPHAISHLNVRVHCSENDEEILGSTSAESTGATLRKLLVKNAGMETLIENVRGAMYSTEQVKKWLPWMQERGGVHSVRYKVSASLCQYMKGFLRAYERAGHALIYGGLQAEPLNGEGAGCAAFGMSFLKVAGLYDRIFDTKFIRNIKIPLATMNLPGAPAKFNFYDFYLGRGPSWAEISEPHRSLSFWDPQLMHAWVENVARGREFWFRDHEVQKKGKSFVLQVDARHVRTPKNAFSFSFSHLKRVQAEVHRLWSSSQDGLN